MTALNGRPDYTMSENTLILVNALRQVNEDISYASLSGMVGFNVSGASRYLTSARRHLKEKDNIVFAVIWGQGLRRLNDSGKVAATAQVRKRAYRVLANGKKLLATIEDFAGLSNADQLKATLAATQFEFAQQAMSGKAISPPKAGNKLDVKALITGAIGKKK